MPHGRPIGRKRTCSSDARRVFSVDSYGKWYDLPHHISRTYHIINHVRYRTENDRVDRPFYARVRARKTGLMKKHTSGTQ